jgi:hypothetical protein
MLRVSEIGKREAEQKDRCCKAASRRPALFL